MNTPADEGSPELRYAEYVLGVLDAPARADVAREMATSETAAAAVAAWQRRLLPLADEIESHEPSPALWQRIEAALGLGAPLRPARAAAPAGLWDSLRFWRWLSIAGGALFAAACTLLVLFVLRRPAAPAIPYMASTITEQHGRVGWTATMDIAQARIVVVPAAPEPLSAGRAPELWLIPKGRKPMAVGMISTAAPVAIQLAPALVTQLGPTAVLAVSVEPPGGSATGQPTGPVIATGTIGAAAAAAHPPRRSDRPEPGTNSTRSLRLRNSILRPPAPSAGWRSPRPWSRSFCGSRTAIRRRRRATSGPSDERHRIHSCPRHVYATTPTDGGLRCPSPNPLPLPRRALPAACRG